MLLGPVTNVAEGLIGGATISFDLLASHLEGKEIGLTIINTKKYTRGLKCYLNPLLILIGVFVNIHATDVVFLNSSRGGTKFLSPLLFLLSKLFRKKYIFRPFGGDIKDYSNDYNPFQKWIFSNTILKSDIFFLQTNALLQYYSKIATNPKLFPTCREEPQETFFEERGAYSKRFVFIGFVNKPKGIDIILKAAKRLDDSYTVHIYGPIKEAKYHNNPEGFSKLYQGILKKQFVLQTIQNYDVLILPTFYEGEGYPGVIIEAYSLGIPVIASNWKSIPEIVLPGKTGVLIEPRSVDALVEAMQQFTTCNYPDYSKNARGYFVSNSNAEIVVDEVLRQINILFDDV